MRSQLSSCWSILEPLPVIMSCSDHRSLGGTQVKHEPHQLLQPEELTPEVSLDEEDVLLLLERTHLVLTTVLDARLRTSVRSDAAQLLKDIDQCLSAQRLH